MNQRLPFLVLLLLQVALLFPEADAGPFWVTERRVSNMAIGTEFRLKKLEWAIYEETPHTRTSLKGTFRDLHNVDSFTDYNRDCNKQMFIYSFPITLAVPAHHECLGPNYYAVSYGSTFAREYHIYNDAGDGYWRPSNAGDQQQYPSVFAQSAVVACRRRDQCKLEVSDYDIIMAPDDQNGFNEVFLCEAGVLNKWISFRYNTDVWFRDVDGSPAHKIDPNAESGAGWRHVYVRNKSVKMTLRVGDKDTWNTACGSPKTASNAQEIVLWPDQDGIIDYELAASNGNIHCMKIETLPDASCDIALHESGAGRFEPSQYFKVTWIPHWGHGTGHDTLLLPAALQQLSINLDLVATWKPLVDFWTAREIASCKTGYIEDLYSGGTYIGNCLYLTDAECNTATLPGTCTHYDITVHARMACGDDLANGKCTANNQKTVFDYQHDLHLDCAAYKVVNETKNGCKPVGCDNGWYWDISAGACVDGVTCTGNLINRYATSGAYPGSCACPTADNIFPELDANGGLSCTVCSTCTSVGQYLKTKCYGSFAVNNNGAEYIDSSDTECADCTTRCAEGFFVECKGDSGGETSICERCDCGEGEDYCALGSYCFTDLSSCNGEKFNHSDSSSCRLFSETVACPASTFLDAGRFGPARQAATHFNTTSLAVDLEAVVCSDCVHPANRGLAAGAQPLACPICNTPGEFWTDCAFNSTQQPECEPCTEFVRVRPFGGSATVRHNRTLQNGAESWLHVDDTSNPACFDECETRCEPHFFRNQSTGLCDSLESYMDLFPCAAGWYQGMCSAVGACEGGPPACQECGKPKPEHCSPGHAYLNLCTPTFAQLDNGDPAFRESTCALCTELTCGTGQFFYPCHVTLNQKYAYSDNGVCLNCGYFGSGSLPANAAWLPDGDASTAECEWRCDAGFYQTGSTCTACSTDPVATCPSCGSVEACAGYEVLPCTEPGRQEQAGCVCKPGYSYALQGGETVCTPCADYTVSSGGTQAACTPCPLGYQADQQQGGVACLPCAKSYWRGWKQTIQGSVVADQCEPCRLGTADMEASAYCYERCKTGTGQRAVLAAEWRGYIFNHPNSTWLRYVNPQPPMLCSNYSSSPLFGAEGVQTCSPALDPNSLQWIAGDTLDTNLAQHLTANSPKPTFACGSCTDGFSYARNFDFEEQDVNYANAEVPHHVLA